MPRNRLIIFVKAPRPGQVKTRLASSIGAEAAAEAYQLLAESLFQNLAELTDVELRFTPRDAHDEIRPWLREDWTPAPQCRGELGNRLQDAFRSAFADGCNKIAIIGSDCPDVTAEDIREAWARLDSRDLVLGPATDGGYWLVALKKPCARLFQNISWSTDRVLAQTIAAGTEAGLKIDCLRRLTDVDTLDEWREFVKNRQPE
jgi:rSAM/selenodomain-associated transferase 1